MIFRFAVWAAVSSDEQLDRASIPSQIELSRAAGLRLGGEESAGPYIADGYSRTGYYDLSQAASDIPALGLLLRELDLWDVLILKNFDRLGDLGKPLYNFLSRRKKQLHSVQQSTLIYPPDEYDPHRDTATALMIATTGISQVYRIAKIVDAFKTGNPQRAKDGKYSTQLPTGYIKKDKATVLVDPSTAPLLQDMAQWFLQGTTLSGIARRANLSGTKPPRAKAWSFGVIEYILRNPFYAGKTFYGQGTHAPNGYRRHDPATVILYEGRHEPLWSWDTHLAILAEFERRKNLRTSPQNYNFTGLIKCAVCGNTLRILYSPQKMKNKYWYCQGHVSIRVDTMNELVATELEHLFSNDELPNEQIHASRVNKELSTLENRLKRLDRENEAGAYTPEEFAQKRKELRAKMGELRNTERQEHEARRRSQEHQRAITSMQELLPHIRGWISGEDPLTVRFHLSRIITITAHPDKTITVGLI